MKTLILYQTNQARGNLTSITTLPSSSAGIDEALATARKGNKAYLMVIERATALPRDCVDLRNICQELLVAKRYKEITVE